jgi:hypothetical protein
MRDALNLWCGAHACEVLRRKLARRAPHLRYQTPWRIRRAIAAAGLVNTKVFWMPILPRRWQRFQRALERPPAQAIFQHVPFAGMLFCHAFIVRADKPGVGYAASPAG